MGLLVALHHGVWGDVHCSDGKEMALRQKIFRKWLFQDLVSYGLLQSYALAIVIRFAVESMDAKTGWSSLGLVSDWPLWFQVVFFVFLHDFYIYWFHRWQHVNKYLWRIHEAHHSAVDVDWIAGSRSHSLEIMINQTIEFGVILLLGAHPDVLLIKGAISVVWGMWIHANIDVKTGWVQKIINGPEMHRWHHAKNYIEPGMNYGTKFAFWDWIFKTAYLPKEKPDGYGLDIDFPDSYFVQHVFAFRKFKNQRTTKPKMIRPCAGSGSESTEMSFIYSNKAEAKDPVSKRI